MTDILIVGIGGALGSLVRYRLGRWISERSRSAFPLGTFMINISGAFLLGIVISLNLDPTAGILLADGFLGAYTTFSTFLYEGFDLFSETEKANAAAYIAGSILLGIIGYMAGANMIQYF